MVEILNTVILLLFTGGLLASNVIIARRFNDYFKEGIQPPLLAYRDLGLLAGLAFPFLLIFIIRAAGLTPMVAGTIWWTLVTGIPPIVGVAQFLYFELFIIEKGLSRGYIKYMKSRDAQEDKEFGDKRRELEVEHSEALDE